MSRKKNKTETYIDSDGSELTIRRVGRSSVEYLNSKGEYHRLDGPACEYADGTKHWYQNGYCHRLDGPAIEYANGTKHWYVDGKCHRLDGPAIEYAGGDKYWYIDGVRVEPSDPRLTANKRKEAAMSETYIDSDGSELTVEHGETCKRYYNPQKQLHRLDGPAYEWANGTKLWYIDNVRVEPTDPRLTCNKPIQDRQKTTFVYLLFRAEQQSRPVVYLSIESAMRAKRPGDTVEVAEALA